MISLWSSTQITTAEAFALLADMEWCQVWEPSIGSGVTTQGEKQALLWGTYEPLWEEPVVVEPETGGGYLPKRKNRKPRWQERDEEREKYAKFLEGVYQEITGERPDTPVEKEIVREAVKAVSPYTPGKPKRPPPVSKIDFVALADNVERAERLLVLAERKREEEEAVYTLLLM